jgi:hypothetical protein
MRYKRRIDKGMGWEMGWKMSSLIDPARKRWNLALGTPHWQSAGP